LSFGSDIHVAVGQYRVEEKKYLLNILGQPFLTPAKYGKKGIISINRGRLGREGCGRCFAKK